MRRTLQERPSPATSKRLKVIVAEGRMPARTPAPHQTLDRLAAARGERVAREVRRRRDVCTGDHACIRLSGCPSLTLKDNPDPLRSTRWPP